MAEARRPASLVWFLPATAAATLACLLEGLGVFPRPDEESGLLRALMSLYERPESSGWLTWSVEWSWLSVFGIGLGALLLAFKKRPQAPAWLLLFWTLGLSLVPGLAPRADPFEMFLTGSVPDTQIGLMLMQASNYAKGALGFLLLLVPWLLVARVTLAPNFRSWFGFELEPARGYLSRDRAGQGWNRLRPLLLATVLCSVWGSLSFLSIFLFIPDSSPYQAPMTVAMDAVFMALNLIPFAVCAGMVLWLRYERLTVDRGGVQLSVFRISFFFAPWHRIRSIDVVEHDRHPRSVVLAYQSRFFLPFSLGVHAKRYLKGEEAIDAILLEAAQRGVPIRRWHSADRTVALGWLAIGLGILLLVLHNFESVQLMRGFDDPDFITNMDVLAGLFPLTGLHVASILFVGLGFGFLSAHHRGGSRPVLLVLLAIATHSFPDPIIHWLVWIAIYAIVTARLSPLIVFPVAPHPPDMQWEIAFGFFKYASAFVIVGYYVGVALGRRRIQGTRHVRQPMPGSEGSLVAGSAKRLEDV